MSHSQLAKLFLRGSLMNKTAANLTEDQKAKVEETLEEVWNDPNLQGHKYAFCEALRNTIRTEYMDHECGEQEARIAMWRACVSILFHDQKMKPNDRERIISDPKQRAKYLKTWVMNYMKQILRENKRPAIKKLPEAAGCSCHVAAQVIESFIEFKGELHEEIEEIEDGGFIISGIDQRSWPLSLSLDIKKLAELYGEFGVKILSKNDKIEILPTKKEQPQIVGRLIKTVRVKGVSLNHKTPNDDDENSLRYTLEWKMFQNSNQKPDHYDIDESEVLDTIRSRLPDSAVPVFDVIVNSPQEFVTEYGDKPRKSQIAKFLGRSVKEVNEAYAMIRNHYRALD